MKRYQAEAPTLKTDPIGFAFVPFGYAAGQVLAQAVTETKSFDHDKLAAYLHSHTFLTVVGETSQCPQYVRSCAAYVGKPGIHQAGRNRRE